MRPSGTSVDRGADAPRAEGAKKKNMPPHKLTNQTANLVRVISELVRVRHPVSELVWVRPPVSELVRVRHPSLVS